MRFELKNIGPISDAVVDLDGITVLAGANSSGKSTIEKAVALYFQSLYNISDYIHFERYETVYGTIQKAGNSLDTIAKKISSAKRRHKVSMVEALQQEYSTTIIDNLPLNDKELKKIIEKYALSHAAVYNLSKSDLRQSNEFTNWIDETAQLIKDDISYSDDDIGRISVTQFARKIFADQIIRFGHEKEGAILRVRDNDLINEMHFLRIHKSARDFCDNLRNDFSVDSPVVYIDSPDIFDNIKANSEQDVSKLLLLRLIPGTSHSASTDKSYILKDLTNAFSHSKKSTAIQKEQAQKRVDRFYSMIGDVVQGHLELTVAGRLQFVPQKGNRAVEMSNVSSGIKSLTTLAYAIENQCIIEGSTLILDEPEINLHPEWQLKYAEILVMMQKEMNLNILISTHSPYFLEAIEAYSNKYGINKKCRYYFMNNKDGEVSSNEVTDDIRPIYAELARPYRELEKIEAEYEKTK